MKADSIVTFLPSILVWLPFAIGLLVLAKAIFVLHGTEEESAVSSTPWGAVLRHTVAAFFILGPASVALGFSWHGTAGGPTSLGFFLTFCAALVYLAIIAKEHGLGWGHAAVVFLCVLGAASPVNLLLALDLSLCRF